MGPDCLVSQDCLTVEYRPQTLPNIREVPIPPSYAVTAVASKERYNVTLKRGYKPLEG